MKNLRGIALIAGLCDAAARNAGLNPPKPTPQPVEVLDHTLSRRERRRLKRGKRR